MTAAQMSDSLAVVTVAFDSDEVLVRFMDSIIEATGTSPTTVIVDNAPHLGAASDIANAYNAEYLPLRTNPGYGAAVNRAIARLPPDVGWVLIANPDVVLLPDSIDKMLERIRADVNIAAVGPEIRNPDGTVYPSARAIPSLRTGVGHALFANLWPENPWSRGYHRSNDQSPSRDAGWLSGACILVRRMAFQAVGGFDEGFFMYFEDVDLGARFSKAGYRNVYDRSAAVVHLGAHSTRTRSETMVRVHHRSANRYIAQRYPSIWAFPLRLVLRLGLNARTLWTTTRTRRRFSIDATRSQHHDRP